MRVWSTRRPGAVWIVPVSSSRHEWSVMWWQEESVAVITYVGPWPLT